MTKKLNLFRNHYKNENKNDNFLAKTFKNDIYHDNLNYYEYDDSIVLEEEISYDNYEITFTNNKNSIEYIYDLYDSDDYID